MNKKKKRRIKRLIFGIVLLLIAGVAITLLLLPPVPGRVTRTGVEKYEKWSKYVQNMIDDKLVGALPGAEFVEKYGTDYRYEYRCAPVGDPIFSVSLTCVIDDETDYRLEKARIAYIFEEREGDFGGKTFFARPDYERNLFKLNDHYLNSGVPYQFENVFFDDATRTVVWYAAYLWDDGVLPGGFEENCPAVGD